MTRFERPYGKIRENKFHRKIGKTIHSPLTLENPRLKSKHRVDAAGEAFEMILRRNYIKKKKKNTITTVSYRNAVHEKKANYFRRVDAPRTVLGFQRMSESYCCCDDWWKRVLMCCTTVITRTCVSVFGVGVMILCGAMTWPRSPRGTHVNQSRLGIRFVSVTRAIPPHNTRRRRCRRRRGRLPNTSRTPCKTVKT